MRLSSSLKWLNGHEYSVNVISISKPFSVAVSGDTIGCCIVWDLNRFCYVRTISHHESAIRFLCVSETLGDIVSVSDRNNFEGSSMMVNTINGTVIGHVKTETKITAVCYSTAPEGLSINVIATGFMNGIIR
jgi:lysosomal-trafficking regulator